MAKFVLGIEDLKDNSAKMSSMMDEQLRLVESENLSKSVPRHPEHTLSTILLTVDDLSKRDLPPESEQEVEQIIQTNDDIVIQDKSGPKEEAIRTFRNQDKDFALQAELKNLVEQTIQASGDDESYQQLMRQTMAKAQEYNAFAQEKRGASTSLLDIMSDLTEPDVPRYGTYRKLWLNGYRDLMKMNGNAPIPTDEEQVQLFIETARAIESSFSAQDFPEKPEALNVLSMGPDPRVSIGQSAGFPALVALSETKLVKAMAEHPYITSAVLDAVVTLTPPLLKPATGIATTAASLAVARAAVMKKFGKLTIPELVTKLGINKKLFAERLIAARVPAATQIGLGLGAVYVAGEMLKDGSSKTAAFLTEVFGPAGAMVLFQLSKPAVTTYLRHLSTKNATLFRKLNTELAERGDLLAKEWMTQMRDAVQNQGAAMAKTTEQVAKDMAAMDMSPLAKVVAHSESMDKWAADNITSMLETSLKGRGKEAEMIREVVRLDGLEGLASSATLREFAKVQLNTSDNIDDLVKILHDVPELGAAFRGVGAEMGHTISFLKKQLKSAPTKEAKAAVAKELKQAQKIQAGFQEAAVKFDLNAFDKSLPAFLQSPQAQVMFGSLPQFQGISGRILYKEMAEQFSGNATKIQEKTYKFLQTNVRSMESQLRKDITFGIEPGVWDAGNRGMVGKALEEGLLTPSAKFRDAAGELVDVPARAMERQRVMAAQFADQWRNIRRAVPRKHRQQLIDILQEGAMAEEVFQPTIGGLKAADGTIIKATPEVVDAYYASVNLMEGAYRIANLGVVKTARAKGFRMLDEKILVQPRKATVGFVDSNGVRVTEEMVDEGYHLVNIFDDDGKAVQTLLMSPEQMNKRVADISDYTELLGHRTGYLPIDYEGKWRVASIKLDDDGKFIVKTEAIAKTPKDAHKAVGSLIEREGADSQTLFMAVRDNVQPAGLKAQIRGGRISPKGKSEPAAKETITSFIKTLDADSALQKMTDEELDALAEAMSKAGFGREVADNMISEARYFSGPKHTRRRASERPRDALDLDKPAPQVHVDEAVSHYWDKISQHANLGDIVAQQQDKFLATYGRYLENPNDWSSKVQIGKAREFGGVDEGAKAMEAWAVQHQIKVISGMRSAEQVAFDSMTASVRDKMIQKGNFRLAKVMDDLSSSAEIQGTIRSLTARGVFGLWNASHYLVQASGALFTLGRASVHNPVDIQKAMKSSLKYAYGRKATQLGLPMDEETKFLVKYIDQSGYLNNVNYAALDDLVGHKTSGMAKAFDKSVYFTKKGEATQRLFAFNWNFHHNSRLAKAGKHPLGFTEKDITSTKFMDYVKNQSDITAFNMNKVNQPLYAQGTAGLSFQFAQILSQMGQLFFGAGEKTLTKIERMGLWATSIAALGPKAVPLAETAMAFVDNYLAKDVRTGNVVLKEGQPQDAGKIRQQAERDIALFIADNMKRLGFEGDEKYWRRFASGGLISAATEGTIDIANRATLQLLTNTYYDNLSPSDAMGPGLNILIMMMSGTLQGVTDLVDAMSSEEGIQENDVIKAAKKSFGVLGGARNILGTIEALKTGKVTTRGGQAIIDGLRLKEIMSLSTMEETTERVKDVFGIASGLPGERQRTAMKENEIQMRQREAWNEWSDITIGAIRRAVREGNFDTAYGLLDASVEQVYEYRPSAVSRYLKRAFWAMNTDPDATIEDRNRLDAIRFNLAGEDEKPLF